MDCIAGETLQAYEENDLPVEERRRISAHLGACSRCRGELVLLRRMDEALSEEPLLEPAAGFAREVIARLALQPRAASSKWFLAAWAAVFVLAIGIALWRGWGADLGWASQRMTVWMEEKSEQAITSTAVGVGSIEQGLENWTRAYTRWVLEGVYALARAARSPLLLIAALICVASLALYQYLAALYEAPGRSPSRSQSAGK